MALTDEQKTMIEEKANDFMTEEEGFSSIYETYLQGVVELAEINAENVDEADELFRKKIKEFLGGENNGG